MLPRLFITDIDGVWTDGGMYYTAHGDIMKRFCVKDGWGVIFLRRLGIPVAIITGENTPVVAERARKLNIEHCYLGVKDKVAVATELCEKLGITLADAAFIGDDLNDVGLLRLVGRSGCPANTPPYVSRLVRHRGRVHGGHGAFREFVETILAEEGLLDSLLDQFLE